MLSLSFIIRFSKDPIFSWTMRSPSLNSGWRVNCSLIPSLSHSEKKFAHLHSDRNFSRYIDIQTLRFRLNLAVLLNFLTTKFSIVDESEAGQSPEKVAAGNFPEASRKPLKDIDPEIVSGRQSLNKAACLIGRRPAIRKEFYFLLFRTLDAEGFDPCTQSRRFDLQQRGSAIRARYPPARGIYCTNNVRTSRLVPVPRSHPNSTMKSHPDFSPSTNQHS